MSAEDIPPEPPEDRRPPDGRQLPGLSNRSRELLAILARQEGRPERFYEGALLALGDGGNPVGPEMASYALRELIEELERVGSVVEKGPRLGDLLSDFGPKWMAATRRPDDRGLVDPCDPAVFAVDEFLAGAEKGWTTRRDRAQETLIGLDPVRREGPPDTQAERVETLLRFRRDFNDALHGESPTDPVAFKSRVEAFERFLLDLFRPSTFTDFDAIDDILEGGPPA